LHWANALAAKPKVKTILLRRTGRVDFMGKPPEVHHWRQLLLRRLVQRIAPTLNLNAVLTFLYDLTRYADASHELRHNPLA
jgi:hypothetical protein